LNGARNEAAAAKSSMSPDCFEYISRLPLFIFVMVAGADNKIDRKEVAAFSELLRTPVCL